MYIYIYTHTHMIQEEYEKIWEVLHESLSSAAFVDRWPFTLRSESLTQVGQAWNACLGPGQPRTEKGWFENWSHWVTLSHTGHLNWKLWSRMTWNDLEWLGMHRSSASHSRSRHKLPWCKWPESGIRTWKSKRSKLLEMLADFYIILLFYDTIRHQIDIK